MTDHFPAEAGPTDRAQPCGTGFRREGVSGNTAILMAPQWAISRLKPVPLTVRKPAGLALAGKASAATRNVDGA
jgi:hypothetical protein